MSANQFELCLPLPSTDDVIAERLTERVEEFNASADPLERVQLHGEIKRLRAMLSSGKRLTP